MAECRRNEKPRRAKEVFVAKISISQHYEQRGGNALVSIPTSASVYMMLCEVLKNLHPHADEMVQVFKVQWQMYPVVWFDEPHALYAQH